MEEGRRGVRTARRSENGFTLLELTTVVVVVAITAAFVVHGAGRVGPRLAASAEAAKVAALVAETRARAMAEQRDLRLEILGGRQLRVSAWERGGWVGRGRPTALGPQVSARIDGSPSGSVRFLRQGRVAAPATIVIQGSERTEVLSILASGMTRSELR